MRGTHLPHQTLRPHARITPAHAGNTGHCRRSRCPIRDHPRACGEHGLTHPCGHLHTGSPPCMRGTLVSFRFPHAEYRITPAHAGNTCSHLFFHLPARDHPRACGEHCGLYSLCALPSGSPPRMRGTLYGIILLNASRRITPAHAGNTRPSAGHAVAVQDHPRACGEHLSRKSLMCA